MNTVIGPGSNRKWPRPLFAEVAGHVVRASSSIRHRNALTERAWEDAVQGPGKDSSTGISMPKTISVTQDGVRLRYLTVALFLPNLKYTFYIFLAKTSIITKTIIIIGIILDLTPRSILWYFCKHNLSKPKWNWFVQRFWNKIYRFARS